MRKKAILVLPLIVLIAILLAFYFFVPRENKAPSFSPLVALIDLDEKTLEELRTLGYIK